jgi:hypothetical protein
VDLGAHISDDRRPDDANQQIAERANLEGAVAGSTAGDD